MSITVFRDCCHDRHQRPYGHSSERPASTMEVENMVHSDSISPDSLGIRSKLWQRWQLKISLIGDSARRSQQTLTVRLGLPSLSSFLPHHRIQLTTRWLSVDNSAPLLTRVSKTYGRRSDETTTKSIIDLRSRVSWCHVH